nr:ketohexokinase isoform X1 [Halyomorpha halys]
MFQKILCVGMNCFDIIQICKNYPLEDSEQRSTEYRMQRGGNASNNSTVLSLLGSICEFMGTISKNTFWEFIQKDFEKYSIDISGCKIYYESQFPVSTIIINDQNGSRTIVHSNKDLPELDYEHFKKINLKNYSWIHFEGRNVSQVLKMMKSVNDYNNACGHPITISVELEKRKEALSLAELADIVFVGKEFSNTYNWDGMETTLREMRKHVKSRISNHDYYVLHITKFTEIEPLLEKMQV